MINLAKPHIPEPIPDNPIKAQTFHSIRLSILYRSTIECSPLDDLILNDRIFAQGGLAQKFLYARLGVLLDVVHDDIFDVVEIIDHTRLHNGCLRLHRDEPTHLRCLLLLFSFLQPLLSLLH